MTTSERVVAMTAKAISRVAKLAAWMPLQPFSSMVRWMFSSTTMASSMTIPTANTIPSIVKLFRVYPMARINVNVATSEAGMAMEAITVPRQSWRKKNTVIATSTAPSIR